MFWYFVLLALLAVLAMNERGDRRLPGAIAAAMLAGFAGLRYETGFDWLEYEFLYAFAPKLGVINTYQGVGSIDVEPGYVLAMAVFKTMGLGFQTFMFAISVFNLYFVYRICRQYTFHIALALIWYYGFVFLSGQMSTIRQGLSISFIFWAILLRERNRPITAIMVGAISVAFHSFSIIFLPFLVLTRRTPKWFFVAIACLPGLILYTMDISVFQFVVRLVTPILGAGLVGDKLSMYGEASGAALSPFVLILIAWHIFFLRCNQSSLTPDRSDYFFRNFTGWIAVLNLFSHTYVADFPIVWNRVMLVSFFLEAVVLSMIYGRQLAEPAYRTIAITVASLGATLSLVYTLTRSQALAFTPYQSMAVVWVRGDYGDGRVRYQIVRGEIDRAALESRTGQ